MCKTSRSASCGRRPARFDADGIEEPQQATNPGRARQAEGHAQRSGGPGNATFTIQAHRETLRDVLKLLKEILREPTLPESELELIRQAELAQLKSQLSEPGALAGNAIRRHMAPYDKDDPRYVSTLPESIDALQALTVAEVRKVYSNYMNGSHGELAIVGDFDKAQVLPVLNETLGDWKAEMPYAATSRAT